MEDLDLGPRAQRAVDRQRRAVVRARLLAVVLVIVLIASNAFWLLRPAQPVAAEPQPAETVTETATEVETETRLVLQEQSPVVTSRLLPVSELRADVFQLRVQAECRFRALNYDIGGEVTNTSSGLAGGVRMRLLYYNVQEQLIGAADADLPVLEPGASAAVVYSATVPCRGAMGSQTVTRIEAELL